MFGDLYLNTKVQHYSMNKFHHKKPQRMNESLLKTGITMVNLSPKIKLARI